MKLEPNGIAYCSVFSLWFSVCIWIQPVSSILIIYFQKTIESFSFQHITQFASVLISSMIFSVWEPLCFQCVPLIFLSSIYWGLPDIVSRWGTWHSWTLANQVKIIKTITKQEVKLTRDMKGNNIQSKTGKKNHHKKSNEIIFMHLQNKKSSFQKCVHQHTETDSYFGQRCHNW